MVCRPECFGLNTLSVTFPLVLPLATTSAVAGRAIVAAATRAARMRCEGRGVICSGAGGVPVAEEIDLPEAHSYFPMANLDCSSSERLTGALLPRRQRALGRRVVGLAGPI